MVGMEITVKYDGCSDQSAKSLARMACVKPTVPASARKAGAESFATHATSVEETHQNCLEDEGILVLLVETRICDNLKNFFENKNLQFS
jgi:hypothetical protein